MFLRRCDPPPEQDVERVRRKGGFCYRTGPCRPWYRTISVEDRDDTSVAPVRGDEARVVAQFSAWLQDAGWQVSTEVDSCDVVATR